jgi:hypothetical protein
MAPLLDHRNFGISFAGTFTDDEGGELLVGKLWLNLEENTFLSNCEYWRREQYEDSWFRALTRLIHRTSPSVPLINSIAGHGSTLSFLQAWTLYAEEGVVFVRENIWVADDLRHVTLDSIDALLPQRREETSDGERAWEKTVLRTDIDEFYDTCPFTI